jgi:hypothetical protein
MINYLYHIKIHSWAGGPTGGFFLRPGSDNKKIAQSPKAPSYFQFKQLTAGEDNR